MPQIEFPRVNIGRHPDEAADTIWTLPVDVTDLRLETPSRFVHENPATRDVVTINRGPAYWFLTLTIGSIEVNTPLHHEYEQWLARMHDLRNHSPIPLGDRASSLLIKGIPSNLNARSVQSVAGNALTLNYALNYVTTESDQPYSAPEGGAPVPPGTYIRVDNQMAMVDSIDPTGRTIVTNPIIGAVGAFVSVTDYMRCRLAGGGNYRITTTGGLTDPLTLQFVEHR